MKTLLKVVQRLQGMHCPYLRTSQRHYFSTNDQQSNKPPQPQSPPQSSANEKSLESSTLDQASVSQKDTKNNAQQISVQLSPEAQRAVLASKVFKVISAATFPVQMKKSLRQQVIDAVVTAKHQGFTLEDKIKDEILQMVTTGVNIDLEVFSQERVQSALYEDEKGVPRLIFYPTATVTSRLFNCMQSHLKFCFFGSFGIGKTISMIFFIHLAKHINKLMYLSLADWVPKEKRDKFYAQYQSLKQQRLLICLPKCWYWSIDLQLEDDEQKLMRILRKQTQEMCLTDELKKQMNSFEKLQDLSSFFFSLQCRTHDDLRTKFVFDQINALISYFRRWNQVIDRSDALIRAKKIKQAQDLKKQKTPLLYNPSKKTLDLFRNIHKIRRNYIVSSSTHVERQLLSKRISKFHLQKLALFFGSPASETLDFNALVKKQNVKLELVQIFCQLLLEKCKIIGVPDKFMSKIRSAFTPHIMKVEKYHRFLFIRQYLNLSQEDYPSSAKSRTISFKMQKIKKIEQIFLPLIDQRQGFESIEKLLKELIANYQRYCFFRCQLIVLKYIQTIGDSNSEIFKRLIIHQIRNLAKFHPAKEKLLIKVEKLQQRVWKYTRKNINVVTTFYQRENYNKQILPVSYYKIEGLLEFQWTAQQFLEITESIDVFQIPSDIEWMNGIPQPFRTMISNSSTASGFAGEYLIAWLIRLSSNVSFNTYRKFESFVGKEVLQLNSKLIFKMAPSSAIFWAFNKKLVMNKPKATIRQNLVEILQAAKRNPDINILGLPQSQVTDANKRKVTKYEDKSQNIDFLFVKFFEDKYFITSFDVTIKNSSVQSKGDSAIDMWQKLLRPDHDPLDTNEYVVKHIVLCRQKQCQNSRYVNQYLSLDFCSIQRFEYDHQDEKLNRILENWKRLAQLQEQQEQSDQKI